MGENPPARKAEPAADATASAALVKVPAERAPAVVENAPPPPTPLAAASDAAGRIDHPETAADILRGGNPAAPAARNAAPAADAADPRLAQDISLRLSVDHKPPVDVRVTDRAGEVRVAVRSADPAMAEIVRSGLSELAERLDRRGFEAEIWRPPAPAPAKSENTGQQESREGGAFGRGAPQDRDHEPRHRQRENQPPWMEDIESSFATALKGTGE